MLFILNNIALINISSIILRFRSQRMSNFSNFIINHTHGHAEIAKVLVKEGADINCTNAEGLTPLMLG